MSYRASAIKSVQRGTITLTGVATNTATITSVTTTLSAVTLLGFKNSDTVGNNENQWVRLDLTNATTVTATRPGATGTVVVSFEVVEFYAWAIRSIQPVSITLAGVTSNTATLGTTLTNTAKTFLYWGGNTSTPTSPAPAAGWCHIALTNTTTVTATRDTGAGTAVVNATVVEFK
jgi:hypothetical protein